MKILRYDSYHDYCRPHSTCILQSKLPEYFVADSLDSRISHDNPLTLSKNLPGKVIPGKNLMNMVTRNYRSK